ncbi:MAG: nucleotidyltransferase domain-containing protein [Candidatus Dojkabacteria bacterium]|nr:nucleotidyltransferase domain-containing protein [Candidatus Dojkabacteria bacterium]
MYKSSKSLFAENKSLAERVNDCVLKLRKAFDPEKIILFGSFARGEFNEDRTLDIMIIARTNERFFDRIKKALLVCRGGNPAIEPIVYTPEEFDLLLSQGEGFLEDALEEGLVLYDKD